MLSALLMLRRLGRALRYAAREEEFLPLVAAGAGLVVAATVAYALGEGWNVVDALYFAIATVTTTSVSDPDLVLTSAWLKLFTVFYLLSGIGLLVEILRRLGVAALAVRDAEQAAKQSGGGPPTGQSS